MPDGVGRCFSAVGGADLGHPGCGQRSTWRFSGMEVVIDRPRFEVPGDVILGLFKDPAGNRVGLVEMENGKAKMP